MAGKVVLAEGRGLLTPCTSLRGCLSVPKTQQLGCPQMEGIQDSKAKSGQISYSPTSEVLHHHLHHSLGVTWSRPEAGLNTSWPGSQGWGATLAASLHSPSSDPQWLMSPPAPGRNQSPRWREQLPSHLPFCSTQAAHNSEETLPPAARSICATQVYQFKIFHFLFFSALLKDHWQNCTIFKAYNTMIW